MVFEDGCQRRDFVHVSDVAAANLAALSRIDLFDPPGLRPYNIGSGVPRTVGELSAALAAVHGGADPVVTGNFHAGDVRHITESSARAGRELGFSPTMTLEAGMAEFAEAAPAP